MPIHLAARQAPQPTTSPIPLPTPLPPPYGRIVVDITDGPSMVEEVIQRTTITAPVYRRRYYGYGTQPAEVTKRLCVTPCAVDLVYGRHELKLTLNGDTRHHDYVQLNFEPESKAYRHNLGFHDAHRGRYILGYFLTILSVIAIPMVTFAAITPSRNLAIGFGVTGGILGLGFGISGIWLLATSRPIEQLGTGTEWRL